MANPKLEAKHIAQAAAQGVAIALSHRGEKLARIPRIICGIPPYIFEAVLHADAEGNVTVKSTEPQAGG